jgi:ABC-type oligopeptide transport system substrate-binding subunit
VSRFIRPWAALAPAVIAALVIAACGSSSSNSSGSSGDAGTGSSSSSGKTIDMVQGTFPQSLDPGKDYTTQGS